MLLFLLDDDMRIPSIWSGHSIEEVREWSLLVDVRLSLDAAALCGGFSNFIGVFENTYERLASIELLSVGYGDVSLLDPLLFDGETRTVRGRN